MAMVDGLRVLTGLYSRWVANCFCDYTAYAFDCKADNDGVPHTPAPTIWDDLFLIEFNLVLALVVWTAYAKGLKELKVT